MDAAFDVEIKVDIRKTFDVLDNDEELSLAIVDAAREVVGDDKLVVRQRRRTASEDFADMLRVVPGSYFLLGQGTGIPVHNPGFLLDDAILPIGASMLARIAESRLA